MSQAMHGHGTHEHAHGNTVHNYRYKYICIVFKIIVSQDLQALPTLGMWWMAGFARAAS